MLLRALQQQPAMTHSRRVASTASLANAMPPSGGAGGASGASADGHEPSPTRDAPRRSLDAVELSERMGIIKEHMIKVRCSSRLIPSHPVISSCSHLIS
jgi:hypothetical protein